MFPWGVDTWLTLASVLIAGGALVFTALARSDAKNSAREVEAQRRESAALAKRMTAAVETIAVAASQRLRYGPGGWAPPSDHDWRAGSPDLFGPPVPPRPPVQHSWYPPTGTRPVPPPTEPPPPRQPPIEPPPQQSPAVPEPQQPPAEPPPQQPPTEPEPEQPPAEPEPRTPPPTYPWPPSQDGRPAAGGPMPVQDPQAPPPTYPWSPAQDGPPAAGWSAQQPPAPPGTPVRPVQAAPHDARGDVPGSSVVQAGPFAWTVEHHEGDRYALRNLGTVVAEGVTIAEVPGLVCEQLPRGVAIVPFAAYSFTARVAAGAVRPSALTVSWSGPEPGVLAVPFPRD